MTEEDRPTISVVVPSYNRAHYLRQTIDSILQQDYPHIECIVIDAGSTDDSVDILKDYGDRISWAIETDRGAFDAINKGWERSSGEILAWLNADDCWEPGAATAIAAHFRAHPVTDVVYGDCGGMDEVGRLVEIFPARQWDLVAAVRECDHVINQAAAFVRRSAVERVGGLYPAWCHDHDLWLRLGASGARFEAIPLHLASSRLQNANLGNVPGVVIPAKLGLTRRFFQLPGLSPELRTLRRRALSNAFVRGFSYLRPRHVTHWGWGLVCLHGAISSDPANTPYVIGEIAREIRHILPSRAQSVLAFALLAAFLWRLGRLERAIKGEK